MSSSMSLTHLYAWRISTSTVICCRSYLIVGLVLKAIWLEKGPDPETDGLVRWRVQDVKNKIQTNFGVKYSMEGTRRAEAGLPSRFAASASSKAQGEIP